MVHSSQLSQDEAMAMIKKMVAVTFSVTLSAMSVAYCYCPIQFHSSYPPLLQTAGARLQFTLQCHILTVVTLYYTFSLVWSVRAKAAWDPTKKETAHLAEVPNKILTNTVEQVLMFVPSTLILSTYLDSTQMAAIPITIVTFAIGRILFALGYMKDPLYRAPGFAITMSVVFLTLAANVYFTLYNHSLLISLPTLAVSLLGLWNLSS
eukprot:GFUD01026552.1.p1 GENE.GFUD01026552.1~~GFUD01026552.1.p1  ORF type:complete len:207 (-),score=36.99 GFUD01026552.1:93-713(-)